MKKMMMMMCRVDVSRFTTCCVIQTIRVYKVPSTQNPFVSSREVGVQSTLNLDRDCDGLAAGGENGDESGPKGWVPQAKQGKGKQLESKAAAAAPNTKPNSSQGDAKAK